METVQIDILNPKAKKLLKNLADLNLIKIIKSQKNPIFWALKQNKGGSKRGNFIGRDYQRGWSSEKITIWAMRK